MEPEQLNADAFIKALDDLRKLFPDKKDTWFSEVKKRFFDTEFIGLDDKGYKKFKIKKNPGLGDRYKQGYRVVTLGEYKFHLCTCMFHKFKDRGGKVCTHIGAAYLRHFYDKHLGRVQYGNPSTNKS
jgi:hypothetical protein